MRPAGLLALLLLPHHARPPDWICTEASQLHVSNDHDRPTTAAEPLRRRFVRTVSWSAAGSAASQLFTMAAGILTARLLGKEVYGELSVVLSTVGMFGQLAGFGLGLTATKYVAEFRQREPARAGNIIALTVRTCWLTGGVAALACFALGPWLARHALAAPGLGEAVRWGGLLILISALGGGLNGVLAGFEAFAAIAGIALRQGVLCLPVTYLLVRQCGLLGGLWAAIVVAAAQQLWLYLAVRRECARHGIRPRGGGAYQELAVLWRFSLPSFLSNTVYQPTTWAANALLVNQLGGFGELGLFNAANRWRMMIMFFPGVLAQSVVPIMSSKYGEGDLRGARRVLHLTLLTVAVTVLPVAGVMALLREQLMGLNGQGFREGATVMLVCLGMSVLQATMVPVGNVIAAQGKMWLGLAMNAGWAVVFLAAFWLLKRHGALGMSFAYLIAYAFHAIWAFSYVSHTLAQGKVDLPASPAPRPDGGSDGAVAGS